MEGFEPPVGCPTLAFEASSFGRSDTSPPTSIGDFEELPPTGRSARTLGDVWRGSPDYRVAKRPDT